uniref:Rna-binding domain-containing protein n=1 Tax=Tetraselmis sp. GSL018 TaxID=582737 RepID=A0A061RUY6_9CHLO
MSSEVGQSPARAENEQQHGSSKNLDDVDDEFLRFQAEISAVEKETKRATTATLTAKPQKNIREEEKAPPPSKPPPSASLKPPVVEPGSMLEQFYEQTMNNSNKQTSLPVVFGQGKGSSGAGPLNASQTNTQAFGTGWTHSSNSSAAPAPQDWAPSIGGNIDNSEKAKLQAEAVAKVKAALAKAGQEKERSQTVQFRQAAGKKWVDPTLSEWPDGDHRIFVGDLGNEVNDETLTKAFQRYPSFIKAKVVRDKWNGKSKGYGFVSFSDAAEFAKVLREMNGKYIGNRPCKLSKSTWQERSDQKPVGAKRTAKDGKAPAVGKAKHSRKHIPLPQ